MVELWDKRRRRMS